MLDEKKGQQHPFLYKEVVALNNDLHSDLKLDLETADYFGFTRDTNSIPLMVSEFGAACVHYPIVFTVDKLPIPTAIVGMRNNENQFVNKEGQWTKGCYLPAYVRRYPFLLAQNKQADLSDAIVCIDPSFSGFNKEKGALILEDGKLSEQAQQMVNLCLSYHNESKLTEAFCLALQAQDLLINRQMVVTGDLAKPFANGNERYTLGDFLVIDEQKLRTLPDDIVIKWFNRGWMQMAYAHLISMGRWSGLILSD